MHTLRWRIATWYALLIIVVIAALGITITLRFEQILRSQAQARLVSTMQDIAHAVAPSPNAFGLFDVGDMLAALTNPDNLERWASPTTFIEVDDLNGYPLAKSFNMGTLPSFGPSGVTPGRPATMREIEVEHRPFLIYSALLGGRVIVQAGQPLDQLYQAFHQARAFIVIILVIAAVAVAVLSYVLASQATNPINELARAMREIGSEGLHRRLRWRGRKDEIGNLAASFDDLLARLEEAFARERQFISDASHELKTPLTSINANAQLLARWGDRDDTIRRESIDTIIDESATLADMVSGMLTLAKADAGEDIPKEPLSLAAIAREAVSGTSARAGEKGLTISLEAAPESPIVEGNPGLLRQMLTNLIDNAIKFTEHGGVTVRVRADGDDAVLEVQDTGPGIDPEELPLVFDRFYRADKSRTRSVPGTGLGLAIVRSIARVHGGSVEAERPPEGGTIFRTRLPRIH
jgi:two-component system OmpR family sensor kinase